MPRPTREQLLAAMKAPTKKPREKKGDGKYTAEEKAKMDAEGRGLGAKSKEWAEKFADMNDGETWLCFVWRTEDKVTEFVERYGLNPDGRLVDGAELAGVLNVDLSIEEKDLPARRMVKYRGDRTLINWQRNYQPHPAPPPREQTDDVVADIRADLDDLLNWPQDPQWLEDHGTTIDYPHYLCVYFGSRKRVTAFLRLTNLIELGDKYLDGDRVTELLDELT